MSLIHTLESNTIAFDPALCEQATVALESGSVIYFPNLPFKVSEQELSVISPDLVTPGIKNISYQPNSHKLKGMAPDNPHKPTVADCMRRFSEFANHLVDTLFPHYHCHYQVAKTSLRPVEIKDRESSYRKDDTRLHVDAFPSNPNQGKRILRVFSNINPNNQSRHWRLGEPFRDVADRFLPQIGKPFPGKNHLLNVLGITKQLRTDYDHYMLEMHNRMKADETYQRDVSQMEFFFPPNTTWIVFTDLVSHAAMAGQYVLEQTFSLPVRAMKHPQHAPLHILEAMLGRKLTHGVESGQVFSFDDQATGSV